MVYFDNAATTRPCDAALKAAAEGFECFGNPSSLHGVGLAASQLVSAARKTVAASIGALEQEIFFTSGATESNNTAIFGAANSVGRHKKRIVVSAVEHPSVANACNALAQLGFEVVFIPPTDDFCERFADAVNTDTCLASCMLCNNETGALFDVSKIFKQVKKISPRTLTHCDAVQAYLKLPLRADRLFADLISFSGHKIHAPKGIGALYVKKGVHIPPLIYGGGQENALRSGTESVPLIAAFGAAVGQLSKNTDARYQHVSLLRERLHEKCAPLDWISFNSPDNGSPYVNSISCAGLRSEVLLHYLESRGIYVSSGSACSKGKKSGVLTAFGIPDAKADSTIRISFCAENTTEEVDALVEALTAAKSELAGVK